MNPDEQIKIILTDDHQLVRAGVRKGLAARKNIEIIGEAENGLDLLQQLEYLQPDIIILDIQMPTMDGPQTLPILKSRYPTIKVIILSMHNDASVIFRMIELGANAYLTMAASSDEVYEAILACNKNWFFINETVKNAIASTKTYKQSEATHSFTDKEIRIMALLLIGKTSQQIAEELDLSPRTVEAIIQKIKTKIKSKPGSNESLSAPTFKYYSAKPAQTVISWKERIKTFFKKFKPF